jgi:L-ribulose-5-phosphate 3-epimerase
MATQTTRREFLAVTAAGALAAAAPLRAAQAKAPLYKISLAEWSINQPLRKGTMQHLDFATIARSVGVDAIEYVN